MTTLVTLTFRGKDCLNYPRFELMSLSQKNIAPGLKETE